LKIEVEVETLGQVEKALQTGAEVIMLDNVSQALLVEDAQLIGKRAIMEASGGVSLESVKSVARTGVNLISVGKLTHSARLRLIHVEANLSPPAS
jgi:nicotinate-nucleotide pyrophosphorylase (carboxylating)